MPAQDPDYADSNFDPRTGVGGPTVINETNIPTETIIQAMQEQYPDLDLAWQTNGNRHQGIFQRDRYISPRGIFQEMRVAQEAAELDDVVSGVIDTTEALAINRVVIETDDEDEDDVWNQILQDIDIEGRMRELWREIFVTSNAYAAVLMGRKPEGYKVKGKTTAGVKRKKTYNNMVVPLALSVLDPLQIVPVGNFMFAQERLAYIASPSQVDVIHSTLAEANSSDLVFKQLIEGYYQIDPTERQLLAQITGDSIPMDRLFLMDQNRTFRVTSTRPAYERFANVRMKSIFELLDMKAQLRQSDRAHLLGSTNFILLVKKGTDDKPAQPGEVAALAAQMNNAAKIPVIIGDHRIHIEIITPKLDHTLSPEKYNSLDSRLTSRLYQIFASGGYQSGSAQDDSIKLIRVVTRGMEARRNIIRNALMKYVILPTFRANDQLLSEPRLRFYPSRITMDFDPNVALYLQDSRALGDLSRHTALAELDIEEENEAMWRKREKEKYDDFFVPPAIQYAPDPVAAGPSEGAPASSPVKNAPSKKAGPAAPKQPVDTKGAGRRGGGNSNGGGTNSASPKSGPPRGPAKSSLRAKLETDGVVEPRNEPPSDDI